MPGPQPDGESTTPGAFLFGDDGPKRQVLSEQQLKANLTALIRSCEGCENVSVIEVTKFDAPDSRDGCNWSLAIVLDPAGVAPEVYALAYASIIGTARESFNLK